MNEVFEDLAVPNAAVGAANAGVTDLEDDRGGIFRIVRFIERRHGDVAQEEAFGFVPGVFLCVESEGFYGVHH